MELKVSVVLRRVCRVRASHRIGDQGRRPLGEALTITHGKVLSYVDGSTLDSSITGQVMEVSAPVKHGNSGGPLLDSRGRLVGVVFAGQFASKDPTSSSELTYVLPLNSVSTLLAQGGSAAVQPCGL